MQKESEEDERGEDSDSGQVVHLELQRIRTSTVAWSSAADRV